MLLFRVRMLAAICLVTLVASIGWPIGGGVHAGDSFQILLEQARSLALEIMEQSDANSFANKYTDPRYETLFLKNRERFISNLEAATFIVTTKSIPIHYKKLSDDNEAGTYGHFVIVNKRECNGYSVLRLAALEVHEAGHLAGFGRRYETALNQISAALISSFRDPKGIQQPRPSRIAVTAQGFSNVAYLNGQHTPTYFYSNISNGVVSNGMVIDGGGTGCPNAYNPNCHNATDETSFQISSGSVGMLYVIVTTPQQPLMPGIPLSSYSSSTVYMGPIDRYLNTTTNFESLCTAAYNASGGATGSNINNLCAPINGSTSLAANTPGTTLTINFVIDIPGSGIFQPDSDDHTTLFMDVISWIPAYATLHDGLSRFTLEPWPNAVHISDIVTGDATFPNTENSFGIRSANFYYGEGPQASQKACPSDSRSVPGFQTLIDAMTHQQVFRSPIKVISYGEEQFPSLEYDTITGLISGKTYYFTAALEDYAGNVGYFLPLSPSSCATPK